MRGSRLAALAIAVALTPGAALANVCEPSRQDPEVDLLLPTGDRCYVDGDCALFVICKDSFSVWVYQESNGIDGLQRNDEFSGDQACGNGDTIIF